MGQRGTCRQGSDLVSAPNAEMGQASEKFQADFVDIDLMRKHRLSQVGLQRALLEEAIL